MKGDKENCCGNQHNNYIDCCSIDQSRRILQARSRTMNIRMNNKSLKEEQDDELQCRWCNDKTETEEHLMENCPILKQELQWLPYSKYFTCGDTEEKWKLSKQVKFIEENIKTLDDENLKKKQSTLLYLNKIN